MVALKFSCVKVACRRAKSLRILSTPEMHKPFQTLHMSQMPEYLKDGIPWWSRAVFSNFWENHQLGLQKV